MQKNFIESSGLWELIADEGCKLVNTANPDVAAGSRLMTTEANVDNYIERPVSELSPVTKAERDIKAAELIRERYTEAEEFALQRKMLNSLMQPMTLCDEAAADSIAEEYAAYNAFVEECKVRAKDPAIYRQPDPEPDELPEGAEETNKQAN